MSSQPLPTASENSEEGRAFLQNRSALFWKVWFFIGLVSVTASSVGTVVEIGTHFYFDLASTAQAGLFWQLFRRGTVSIRVSRAMDLGGLVIQLTLSAFMMRYIFALIASEHPVTSLEGVMMTDGYVSMMLLGGATVVVAIRAAVIPSRPWRTAIVTTLVGAAVISVNTLVVPGAEGSLAWRSLDSAAIPFLPANAALFWLFVIIGCAVISKTVYGLRVEVREARKLGQYVLEEKLGEGGMGVVYRASHAMLRRPTAVKLLPSDKGGELSLARFEKEVQLTAMLTHPNTVTVFDYGRTPDGVFYYAMELLDGATLAELVEIEGPQSFARTVHILEQAARALAEAHGINLIHRDIKPTNIMLVEQGGDADVTKLLDFGLVKELEGPGDASLTQGDTVTGTPLYLPPEAITAPESVDGRSDLYALGAVGYYLLTGQHVFGGASTVEICSHHLHTKPEAPSKRTENPIPADLEKLVLACLEKDPADRPQDALEFTRQLSECEGYGDWTQKNARDWWQKHSQALSDQRKTVAGEKSSEGSLTMDIDYARRQMTTRSG